MSYDSRLSGALALDPTPDPTTAAELRAALDALSAQRDRTSEANAWKLTPLGGGLVCEGGFDWEAQLAWLERVLREVLAPRGVSLLGTLEAIGEDDAPLATVRVGASGVVVERHEEEEGPDEEEGRE